LAKNETEISACKKFEVLTRTNTLLSYPKLLSLNEFSLFCMNNKILKTSICTSNTLVYNAVILNVCFCLEYQKGNEQSFAWFTCSHSDTHLCFVYYVFRISKMQKLISLTID